MSLTTHWSAGVQIRWNGMMAVGPDPISSRLLLRRTLPDVFLDEVDRFHPGAGKPRAWNPMTWLMRGVEWIDGLNSDLTGKSTFVNISVKARKQRQSEKEGQIET